MVSVLALLGIYGSALFLASLLGSGLPRLFSMTHTRTQMILSLVSGLMLGVALLHLIPHSYAAAGAIDTVMVWTLAGLVFMLLLLRWFHFHQHDFVGAAADCALDAGDGHDHAHAHDHAHPPEQALGALGLFVGLCVHTIVDGMALGAVLVSAPMEAGAVGAGYFSPFCYTSRLMRCLSRPSWRPAAGHRPRDGWQVSVSRCCARWSRCYLLWVRRPSWRLTSGYPPLAFAAGAFIVLRWAICCPRSSSVTTAFGQPCCFCWDRDCRIAGVV